VKVGVPTEVKPDEYRVAVTPAGVRELCVHGHEVIIEAGAGLGSSIADEDYSEQGARIVPDADAVFDEAELLLGVKEPQPEEVARLRPEHVLFTYLHLAPAPEPTEGLCASGATYVAYETVEDSAGRLPLLAPMSEVAGKIATQAGAFMLEKPMGGPGVLLGGVPGVAAANVVIIGGDQCGVRRDRNGGRRVRPGQVDRLPARARYDPRVARGHVTHSAVADGVGAAFTPVEDALERAGSRG